MRLTDWHTVERMIRVTEGVRVRLLGEGPPVATWGHDEVVDEIELDGGGPTGVINGRRSLAVPTGAAPWRVGNVVEVESDPALLGVWERFQVRDRVREDGGGITRLMLAPAPAAEESES
jgi:hypothetical protein